MECLFEEEDEEVRLAVKRVCLRKREGTLYLLAERVSWRRDGEASLSHRYADVRCQKISADGNTKVQLELVLHSGQSSTFHFTDESRALRDRDAAKKLLYQLLPRFNRSAAAKAPPPAPLRPDAGGPAVTGGAGGAEKRTGTDNAERPRPADRREAVGIPAAFLGDLQSRRDGERSGSGNVHSADVNDSVFGTPDVLSERAKHDDKVSFASLVARGTKNPLLDLGSLWDGTLGEGYGLPRPPSAPSKTAGGGGSASPASIVRRVNHHSVSLLVSARTPPAAASSPAGEWSDADRGNPADDPRSSQPSSSAKKARLEAVGYEDLREESPPKTVPLNLKRSAHLLPSGRSSGQEDISGSVSRVRQEMSRYKPRLKRVSAGGGVSLQRADGPPPVPADVQEELRELYAAAAPLLRRFWSCFPGGLSAPPLNQEERAAQSSADLRAFGDAKLRPFQERSGRRRDDGRLTSGGNLTRHLEDMMQAADGKFLSWQSRLVQRKRKAASCDGDEVHAHTDIKS